jgi:hypothetical protein
MAKSPAKNTSKPAPPARKVDVTKALSDKHLRLTYLAIVACVLAFIIGGCGLLVLLGKRVP